MAAPRGRLDPMIRIVRGPLPLIAAHPAFAAAGPSRFRLDLEPDFAVPWGGARAWLAIFGERLGAEAVERALAPHRAVLSLVLRRLEPRLDAGERARREEAR